jgi:hypothetical protein
MACDIGARLASEVARLRNVGLAELSRKVGREDRCLRRCNVSPFQGVARAKALVRGRRSCAIAHVALPPATFVAAHPGRVLAAGGAFGDAEAAHKNGCCQGDGGGDLLSKA